MSSEICKEIELDSAKETVFETLKANKSQLKRDFGVIRIGVFGKIPKSEVIKTEDINILVELNQTRFDLWQKLKSFIEDAFFGGLGALKGDVWLILKLGNYHGYILILDSTKSQIQQRLSQNSIFPTILICADCSLVFDLGRYTHSRNFG